MAEYVKDTFATNVLDVHVKDDRYSVRDGLILYKDKIYLVLESRVKEKLMRAVHDVPMASHLGFYKTYRQLRERFIWKGFKEDVLRHVR